MCNVDELIASVLASLADRASATTAAHLVKWLKRKLGDVAANAVDSLEEDPDNLAAQKTLEAHLRLNLEDSSTLVDELRDLLDGRNTNQASQSASAGDNSTIFQTMGNKNRY